MSITGRLSTTAHLRPHRQALALEPSILSEMARLNLKTPFAGLWLDVNDQWHTGQWVGRQEPLGILIDPRSWQADGATHLLAVLMRESGF